VAMLTKDAKYSMPPLPTWFKGHDGIRGFLVAGPLRRRWRMVPMWANAQLAFGTYRWDDEQAVYVAGGLDLVVLRDTQVSEVVSFLDAPFPVYGLPQQLAGADSAYRDEFLEAGERNHA